MTDEDAYTWPPSSFHPAPNETPTFTVNHDSMSGTRYLLSLDSESRFLVVNPSLEYLLGLGEAIHGLAERVAADKAVA